MSFGSRTKCWDRTRAMFSARMARGPFASDLMDFVIEANIILYSGSEVRVLGEIDVMNT